MTIQFDEEKEEKEYDDLKKKEEENLIKILAEEKYHMPFVDLSDLPIENDALRTISKKEAMEKQIAPFKILGKDVYIAIISPKKENMDEIQKIYNENGYLAHFYLASHYSLLKVWERYEELSYASQTQVGGISISSNILDKTIKKVQNTKDVESLINEALNDDTHTTSHVLEIAVAGAIALDASDLHFEPEENFVRLRFRLDGVLQEITRISHNAHKPINSRIKLLSGLKITSSVVAQDGRFSIFLNNDEINVRVSTVPGAYGESIVMRLLNPKTIRVKLENLGIEPDLYEIFIKQINKPNGLILLTGPTGSGKTTTLYSFLQKIYTPEIKIITIEDPIEYHIEGITQTQTDDEKGYTFLEGLRSALRQDPDVIMVGEIRDAETAKTAVESALTGHLVFSTLHTNNAAGAIPRLIDLEVNPKTLVSAISLSIAQRLVRKLCPYCKKEEIIQDKELLIAKNIFENASKYKKDLKKYGVNLDENTKIYKNIGCDKCNNTGYKGRIGIFETINNDEEIEKIIPNNPSEREIKNVAGSQGYLSLREDALIKILRGITTFQEASSVVDFYEE